MSTMVGMQLVSLQKDLGVTFRTEYVHPALEALDVVEGELCDEEALKVQMR